MMRKRFVRSVFSIKAIPLFVFVLILVTPTWYWWARLERLRDEYVMCGGTPQIIDENIKAATDSMKEQNALLLNWAFVALGGIIALLTTTKTHRFAHIKLFFLILSPALSLLTGSLWAGVLFQRRLTYLQLNGCAERGTINDLLGAQSDLLNGAICVLAVFSFLCLSQIVKGTVDPREDRKETQ